jgi:hypothetical protein
MKARQIWDWINKTDYCWLWLGSLDHDGYPNKISIDGGSRQRPYYILYEVKFGSVPPGYLLHHTCETRDCVNPDHIEPKSRGEHSRIHNSHSHCKQGHELTGDNVYITPSTGERKCLTCNRTQARTYRKRRKMIDDLCSS